MTPTFVLALLCIFVGNTGAFSPFQVADDYVSHFDKELHLLKSTVFFSEVVQVRLDIKEDNATEAKVDPEEYDFIIIGAGTSGSVLASRLSEVPEWKVLLLEAGTSEESTTKVPAMQKYLLNTPYTWPYKTIPQNHSCLGTENHQCNIGTGRALGGDTSINDMVYTRGHPTDYDKWADNDLIGWCWESVFPYFKKLEDAYAHDLDRKHHHYGGPIHLENFQHSTHLADQFLEAAHELGIKKIDYNGKERLGFGIPQVTTKYGTRYSAASAYLEEASKRSNLVIKKESNAVEVIVSHHTKEAKGVTYYQGRHKHIAKASKEVILAAGAVNTAQLLLLSGIGPKHDLEKLDIPVVADLHVGDNLRDHVSFIGLNFIINDTHYEDAKLHGCQDDVMDYLRHGKGPLTTTGLELVGFLQTEVSKVKTEYPDIQVLVKATPYHKDHENLKHLNLRKDIYESVFAPLEHTESFTVEIVLLHPKSTGYVKLHGKEHFVYPVIDPNSLSDPDDEDVETILAGIHKVLKLVHTESFQKIGVHLSPYKVPGCDHDDLDDDYWRCAIKHLSINSRHLSGTAKMGPETDKKAVVDQDLRVYGVQNLRVADSSVIPVSISGNLMAANLMIGEQAADKVKKDWLKEKCQCQ